MKILSGIHFVLVILLALLVLFGLSFFVYAEQCNETYSPCGGGCPITDMSEMFRDVTNFDEEIGNITGWDTSCITNMQDMFRDSDFNQDISNWDVSNVINMNRMFSNSDFNQNISDWDVSSVTDMSAMFQYSDFNQNIGNWNVSSVTDMSAMFRSSSFNQSIANWDVSSVTNMGSMFSNSDFNQNIGNWNVSSVTSMQAMFQNSIFNQDINSWDVSSVTNMWRIFFSSKFNRSIANWDVSSVTNMNSMFRSSSFNQSIANWDVSSVTDMSLMFRTSKFNQDINDWDVSSVVSTNWMFWNSDFNQDISNWDVSNVINMNRMFQNSVFNQDIGDWNVSSVTGMSFMFSSSKFNRSIANWDVSSVTDMSRMFSNSDFDQDISGWDVSSVTDMSLMFSNSDFDQDIGEWDVSSVTDMGSMFRTSKFNQDINDWDVSSVTNMNSMFSGFFSHSYFNKSINDWNVSSVTDMSLMFSNSDFDQNISGWDVSSVTNMNSMFQNSVFNQDIGNWNVSSVTDMYSMFRNSIFDYDISSWDVSKVSNLIFFKEGSDFSIENYNSLLLGWSELELESGLTFHAGDSDYHSGAPTNAREKIINEFGWNINDGDLIFLPIIEVTTTSDLQEFYFEVDGIVDIFIDWGDGNTDEISSPGNFSHEYFTAGIYNVTIIGEVNRISFCTGLNDVYCNNDPSLLTDILNPISSSISGINSTYRMFMNTNIEEFSSNIFFDDISQEVLNMESMFQGSSFNQDISNWDVSNALNLANMFRDSPFNQNISNWNTSSVITMSGLFQNSQFNQDISNWDVANVAYMDYMFMNSTFNQNISNWDVTNVKKMKSIFEESNFDQDIGYWDITGLNPSLESGGTQNMFDNSKLSPENYTSILIKWANLSDIPENNVLGAENTFFFQEGEASRQKLINDFNWTINDAGLFFTEGLSIYAQPNQTQAGSEINTSVFFIDEFGEPVSGATITVNEVNGYSFDSGSNIAQTNESGIAVFDDIVINNEGTYSLNFTSEFFSIISDQFNVTNAPLNSIRIIKEPKNTVAGNNINTIILLEDDFGNPYSDVEINVKNYPNKTMSGTVTATSNSSGFITFNDLIINKSNEYLLNFSSRLHDIYVTSNYFLINHSTANRILLSGSELDLNWNDTREFYARIVDIYNNTVSTGPNSTLEIGFSPSSNMYIPSNYVSAINGLASETFTAIRAGAASLTASTAPSLPFATNNLNFEIVDHLAPIIYLDDNLPNVLDKSYIVNISVLNYGGSSLRNVSYRINKRSWHILNDSIDDYQNSFNISQSFDFKPGFNTITIFAEDAYNNKQYKSLDILSLGSINLTLEKSDLDSILNNNFSTRFSDNLNNTLTGIFNINYLQNIDVSFSRPEGPNIIFHNVNATRVKWEDKDINISISDIDFVKGIERYVDIVNKSIIVRNQTEFLRNSSFDYATVNFSIDQGYVNYIYYYPNSSDLSNFDLIENCHFNEFEYDFSEMPCHVNHGDSIIAYLDGFSGVAMGINENPPDVIINFNSSPNWNFTPNLIVSNNVLFNDDIIMAYDGVNETATDLISYNESHRYAIFDARDELHEQERTINFKVVDVSGNINQSESINVKINDTDAPILVETSPSNGSTITNSNFILSIELNKIGNVSYNTSLSSGVCFSEQSSGICSINSNSATTIINLNLTNSAGISSTETIIINYEEPSSISPPTADSDSQSSSLGGSIPPIPDSEENTIEDETNINDSIKESNDYIETSENLNNITEKNTTDYDDFIEEQANYISFNIIQVLISLIVIIIIFEILKKKSSKKNHVSSFAKKDNNLNKEQKIKIPYNEILYLKRNQVLNLNKNQKNKSRKTKIK